MPSILLIRSSKQWGGIERQLLGHALRLRSAGWTPALACLYRGSGEHPLVVEARQQDLKACTISDPHPLSVQQLRRMRSTILALEPDWFHTCDYRADILVYLASRQSPQLAESHGHTEEGRAMKLWNNLDRRVLRQFSAVAAVSTAWETALAAGGIPVQSLHTIGNSTAILAPAPSPPPALLPTPGPHLLYAGRLSPEKGLDIVLSCWPAIRQHFPNACFWVLGAMEDTTYQRRLQVGLQQPGIHALGYKPDIRPWLLAVDVVVVPSRREAWGMTAFEALCGGVPVLATRVGGLPELCRNAPHAYFFQPDDPATFLDQLQVAVAPASPRTGLSRPTTL